MEWREAAKAKLKEIGEAIAADVDGIIDDLKVPDATPAVVDLSTSDETATDEPPATS